MRRDDYTKETLLASGSISANTSTAVLDVRGYDGYSIMNSLTISSGDVSVYLQGSIDGTTYGVIESQLNVTETGTVFFNVDKPYYWYAKILFVVNSGSATVESISSKSAD